MPCSDLPFVARPRVPDRAIWRDARGCGDQLLHLRQAPPRRRCARRDSLRRRARLRGARSHDGTAHRVPRLACARTERHAAGLGDLTDEKASALGKLANRLARILKDSLGATCTPSSSVGVPHLHLHLAPRYPNAPREFWGPRVNEWPDAPRVDEALMRALVSQLAAQVPKW